VPAAARLHALHVLIGGRKATVTTTTTAAADPHLHPHRVVRRLRERGVPQFDVNYLVGERYGRPPGAFARSDVQRSADHTGHLLTTGLPRLAARP
jgi:hypothetical protein